jgi:hypothetical protein
VVRLQVGHHSKVFGWGVASAAGTGLAGAEDSIAGIQKDLRMPASNRVKTVKVASITRLSSRVKACPEKVDERMSEKRKRGSFSET